MFQDNYQAVKGNFAFYQSRKTNAAIKTVEDLKAFLLILSLNRNAYVLDLSGRCRILIKVYYGLINDGPYMPLREYNSYQSNDG